MGILYTYVPLPAKSVHTVQYINERTVVVQIQYIFVFLFLRQLTCNRFVLKFIFNKEDTFIWMGSHQSEVILGGIYPQTFHPHERGGGSLQDQTNREESLDRK